MNVSLWGTSIGLGGGGGVGVLNVFVSYEKKIGEVNPSMLPVFKMGNMLQRRPVILISNYLLIV